MTSPVVSVDIVFHFVEFVRVFLEIFLGVGFGSFFEHLVKFLIFLMQLLLLVSFHSHAESVQGDKALLTLDAVIDIFIFSLHELKTRELHSRFQAFFRVRLHYCGPSIST